MSTYTVAMQFLDGGGRRVGEYHEEFTATGDEEDAVEYVRFVACEEGGTYPVAVSVDYEIGTGGRMIDQGSIDL